MVDWTTVLISFVSSLVVLGGVYVQLKRDKKKENLKDYNNLIMILYELKRNIHRCYWSLKTEGRSVSFGVLYYPAFSKGFEIGASDFKINTYDKIHKIYSILEIVSDNVKKASLSKSYTLNKKCLINKEREHILEDYIEKESNSPGFISSKEKQGFKIEEIPLTIQKDIITSRYHNGIAFIREYLLDFYKLFNQVLIESRDYARKNKFDFPKDLDGYTSDFASKISQELNLTYKKIK